jgi:hypothetical protein
MDDRAWGGRAGSRGMGQADGSKPPEKFLAGRKQGPGWRSTRRANASCGSGRPSKMESPEKMPKEEWMERN